MYENPMHFVSLPRTNHRLCQKNANIERNVDDVHEHSVIMDKSRDGNMRKMQQVFKSEHNQKSISVHGKE